VTLGLDWATRYQQEIQQAIAARQAGNEGMARVCARRAVGHVIGEYLRQSSLSSRASSAYDRLKILGGLPGLSPKAKEIASHFLLRITHEHTLPIEADLIAEAQWLAQELLGEG
jgi:hypothetical protein